MSTQQSADKAPLRAELLDDTPATLRKPLTLVGGVAYAAIWPYVRVTITESRDRGGNIVRHDPPNVTNEQRLFIVRGDGVVFGPGGDKPLEELELEVRLNEIPPSEKLWTASVVKAYRGGYRPAPAEVFNRVADTIDRFIDFDKSLAEQRTMSEMVACYIISTWFLDSFNVIGFLWPNGERGSGKTQLLTLIAELSYLGQVILAGGSYASLRDMADYGATLCFDDAENFSDPKKTDPDKRTLLLAGNRRGNTVPVKEAVADRGWRTRYINTFCARAFSAIRIPDAVLSSRTIILPLIRTPDRYRANADPLEYSLWPHDRRQVIDDLWALGLTHLPQMSDYEKLVNERSVLTGRNLEPWRALLSVASWLDAQGVVGLWGRISNLSLAYQTERQALEREDLPAIVIRALCQLTGYGTDAAVRMANEQSWSLRVSEITDTVRQMAEERNLDVELEQITTRRIGRLMGTMRFAKSPSSQPIWLVTSGDLARWSSSLGLVELRPQGDGSAQGPDEDMSIEERLERASIYEYQGGLSREEADRLADVSTA